MPRNTERVEYITVAVRKDSHLMRQLENDVREKSQPKSHLLVSYAAEYVRLYLGGGVIHIPPVAISCAYEDVPLVEKQENQEPFITSNLNDEDLECYGS